MLVRSKTKKIKECLGASDGPWETVSTHLGEGARGQKVLKEVDRKCEDPGNGKPTAPRGI